MLIAQSPSAGAFVGDGAVDLRAVPYALGVLCILRASWGLFAASGGSRGRLDAGIGAEHLKSAV